MTTPNMASSPHMAWSPPDTTVITGAGGWLGTGLVAALEDGPWARPGRLRLLVHDPAASTDATTLTVTDRRIVSMSSSVTSPMPPTSSDSSTA